MVHKLWKDNGLSAIIRSIDHRCFEFLKHADVWIKDSKLKRWQKHSISLLSNSTLESAQDGKTIMFSY